MKLAQNMTSTRSERRVMAHLNRLINSRQMTKNGKDWLIVATDPFHDTEATCEGFPDVEGSRTIVQCVTQTTNVKTPLSTDANWDCHVFLFPTTPNWDPGNGDSVLPGAFYQTAIDPTGVAEEGSQLSLLPLYAGYNVLTCANGEDWLAATTSDGSSTSAIAWPTTFGAGQVRLIGAAYEVVNTTAEINKQGSVTSYRSPSTETMSLITPGIDAAGRLYQHVEFNALPPTTQPEAALFPNSCTWAAAEGAYGIATMNRTTNVFTAPVPGWSGLIQTPTQASLIAGDARFAYLPAWILVGDDFEYVATANSHTIPFDVHGSVFAGLSSTSTLQITSRYFFERIPDTSDPNLLVLCKPSPSYDPLSLEIYSHAIAELPIAVKVNENPLGEWFEDVLGVVSAALPVVGGALSGVIPGGAVMGAAGSAAASAIAAANKRARTAENTAKNANQKANAVQKQVKAIANVKGRQMPTRKGKMAATRPKGRKAK